MSIVLHYTKTEKQAFIYSDVDVGFNPSLDPVPILSKILGENGYDMICQSDYGGVCCGFMVISPSEKNAKFLQEVLDHMDKNPSLCDQRSFYEVYQSKKSEDISRPSIKLLDVHDGFGNFCHLQPGVLWQPDSDVLERRRDIVGKQFLWHANHTVGVENKMRMLDRFKSIYSTE